MPRLCFGARAQAYLILLPVLSNLRSSWEDEMGINNRLEKSAQESVCSVVVCLDYTVLLILKKC